MKDPFGISKAYVVPAGKEKSASRTALSHLGAGTAAGAGLGVLAAEGATRGRLKIPAKAARSGAKALSSGKEGHAVRGARKAGNAYREAKRLSHARVDFKGPKQQGAGVAGGVVGGYAGFFGGAATGVHTNKKKGNVVSATPTYVVHKSAFGVDHKVSKSVLLPKPFKGLKPLKPKGLKLSKPGANTKTDNTMAGGTH